MRSEMLKLAGRFAVEIRDVGDPNALVPQRVSVRLTDGREVAADLSDVIGSPANPLSRERHLTKFRRNWVSGRTPLDPEIGEQLITLGDVLETVDDCRALTATMVALRIEDDQDRAETAFSVLMAGFVAVLVYNIIGVKLFLAFPKSCHRVSSENRLL